MKKRKSFLRRGSRTKTEELLKEEVKDNDKQVTPDASPSLETPPSCHVAEENVETKEPIPQIHATEPDENDTPVLSVNQACEEIWKSHEPNQAASWLECLHRALLHTPLHAYLVSEVFMCISGAALRFHNQEDEEEDADVLWNVWEEATWAAAALARVCVGVAWRQQLRQRREWLKRKKQGIKHESPGVSESSTPSPTPQSKPLDVVSTDTSHARSDSPMTSSTLESLHQTDKVYPAIPENLPAAMLRFAAIETFLPQMDDIEDPAEKQKWLDRRKSLVEAQRELVLALCYILPEEAPDDPKLLESQLEWTILEAHEPVASMVRLWLESSCMSWNSFPLDNDYDEVMDESKDAYLIAKTLGLRNEIDSITCGSSKSTQSRRNTADINNDELSEKYDIIRDRQRKVLYERVSSGALDSDEIDWWMTLQVVRAIYQLVSAGFRIPQNELGEEIIVYILGIAERGMLLCATDLKSYGTEPDRVVREERLAASSSAMTVVSILSVVASMGLIPINMQTSTVRIMCRVQQRATGWNNSIPSLFPSGDSLGSQEKKEWKEDYDTFLAQREDCISDIEALYWVLLAHSSSAAAVMAVFLEAMRLDEGKDVSDEPSRLHVDSRTRAIRSARIAVDAVSGALWGKPPDIPAVAHLRIYWFRVLCAFRTISSCIHDWIVEMDGRWDEKPEDAIMNDNFVHCGLSLLLQIVVSLKRFAEEELLRAEGLLAPDEWEVVVGIIDENIDKWLRMTDKTSAFQGKSEMINDIQSKVNMLLESLRIFFDQCKQFESCPFNLVIDDECRVKLYSLMLQKAAPYMLPAKGTLLALAVLRSWAATSFAIHRSDTWARTASYIITDVFSVFEDSSFGLYQGYVHAPAVRLEALKLIALGEDIEERLVDPEQFEPSQELSPLEQSLHLREQYLALVNGALLPPLMTLFGVQASNIHVAVVLPLPTASFSVKRIQITTVSACLGTFDNDDLYIEKDDHKLRRFGTKLLGRLYRSGTGEKWHRSTLLKMMLLAAMNYSLHDLKLSEKPSATRGELDLQDLFAGEFHTALQAIRELEKCLQLPFLGTSPNAHESLPPIVDALCSVLIAYGGEPLKERNKMNVSWLAKRRWLAIAAVVPLARLGITHDRLLVLGKQRDISRLVPDQIVNQLIHEYHDDETVSKVNEYHEAGLSPDVAPFIVVSDDHRCSGSQSQSKSSRPTNKTTQLSFISIFSSLLATLHTNLESKLARDQSMPGKSSADMVSHPVENLDSNFRALCFDALGGFVRGGLNFPFTKELVPILKVEVADVAHAEVSARCRCAAAVAESLAIAFEIADESFVGTVDNTEALLRLLLSYCTSNESEAALMGCKALRCFVGFIAEHSAFGALAFEVLLERLLTEPERMNDDVAESLVALLYDIMCASAEEESIFLTSETLSQTFDACWDICSYSESKPGTEVCRLLCVRLVSVLLNRLNSEDACADCKPNATPMSDGLPAADEDVHCTILDDLVAQRILTTRDVFFATNVLLQPSYHESMARDTENINRFVVEDAHTDQEAPFAAWLCGTSTLLTCRLGSLASRYRGWMEIVIRSPTCRRRRLVRLLSTIFLESPELPSTLWVGPSNQSELTESPKASPRESQVLCNRDPFTEPSVEMKKAAAAMKRFDEMFDQSGRRTISSQSAGSEDVLPDATPGRSTPPVPSVRGFREDACSIEEWLRLVLNDSASVQVAVDDLKTLGIAPPLLSATTGVEELDILRCRFLPVERLSIGPRLQRSISILDRVPPLNTHKIALFLATDIFGQETHLAETSLEDMLLSSTAGSPEFLAFTEGLGDLVLTRHLKYFSGGLDTSGFDSDGKLSVMWLDRNDVFARTMVVFHVVPLMPKGQNSRKRHVGNDNVHVMYVEPGCTLDNILRGGQSNGPFASTMVSGEFGFVILFVQTLAGGVIKVSICLRRGLEDDIQRRLNHLVGEHLVSKTAAPRFVRQMAIRADITCLAIMEEQLGRHNWEERQSQLLSMRRHLLTRKEQLKMA